MLVSNLFSLVGIAAISCFAFKFLRFIRLYTRPSSLKRYVYGADPWALVTGASDGIGRGLAQELAQYGFNVVLHGRNPTKLGTVKENLEKEHPNIKFRIAVLDASTASNEQIKQLLKSLNDLHITVVINNVGGGVAPSPFELMPPEEVDSAININARFPTQLTRALLPKLTSMTSPSLIITIGSVADFCVPYDITYGGSKAFNMAWSRSLAVELKDQGKNVEVLAVSVGKVTEVGHYNETATFFTPGARTMAKATLQRVGCGKDVVVGYVGHALQLLVIGILPASVFASVVTPHMRSLWEAEQRKRS